MTLGDKLREFAAMDTKQRTQRLPGLARSFKDSVDSKTLLDLSVTAPHPLRRQLDVAARAVRESRFGQVEPWAGGYTVVSLDEAGNVSGTTTNAVGKVYKKYGDLSPYALKKALFTLHLERAGMLDGLSSERNLRHLESIGLEFGKDVFLGGATLTWEDQTHHVGVSGAELKEDYVRTLLPQGMPHTLEFLAGKADQVFAERVVHGVMYRVPQDEPQFFAELRRAH